MSLDPKKCGDEGEELNITVAVRCRGRNEREIKAKSSVVVSVPDVTGSTEISINTSEDVGITAQMNSKTYTVDKVFGPSANQKLIFEEIAEPLFDDFLRGYNCTVLVYGMTSTGKTYTMTGDEKLYNGDLSESAGIIPRILFKLFDAISFQNNDYIIKCSFIELYNEELKDLLNEYSNTASMKKLRIFDSNVTKSTGSRSGSANNSPLGTTAMSSAIATKNKFQRKSLTNNQPPRMTASKSSLTQLMNSSQQQNQEKNSGIYIQNLQEFQILNAKEGIELLQRGLKYRQVASTKMNDFSSRSHTVFTINLYKEHNGELISISKMNLVDLAGSENISRSGAQHQRAKEAGSINQSLLTLGRVINSLADKNIHIPFRESKLTRLLQDSLGGNTKTALIATISPAKMNSDETCSTLEYAAKAKSIKNKPQLGSIIMKDVLVKNISNELAKIKSDLQSTKSKEGVYMSQNHYKELTNDLESYKTEVQECKRVINGLESQNNMLLKDKKVSNEVNDLQRMKLQTMEESLSHLHDSIEKQYRKEQSLVELMLKLKSSSIEMKNAITRYSEKEKLIQRKMKQIFNDELSKLKSLLAENLKEINQKIDKDNTDVDVNIELIKNEVISVVENTQSEAEKVYSECIDEILMETPIILGSLNDDMATIEELGNQYHNQLSESLSDISKEYNNLKQYFNNHFFKNNHQGLLDYHINQTYNRLQNKSNEIFRQFRANMESYLEENRNLIVESLKISTSEIIKNEMELFRPERTKWENSFGIINKCDSLNNAYFGNLNSSLSHMKSTVDSSSGFIEKSVSRMKSHIENSQDMFSILNNNKNINIHFKEILEKNKKFESYLNESVDATENSIAAFDKLNESIYVAFEKYRLPNLYDNTDKSELSVNNPINGTEKLPLNPISYSANRLSRSNSPIKPETDHSKRQSGQQRILKRAYSIEESNITHNKTQRNK